MPKEIYKQKNGKNWQYYFSLAGQRYRGSTFTSNKQKAKEFVANLKKQVYDEVCLDKKVDNKIFLEDLMVSYIENGMQSLKKQTQLDYMMYFQRFLKVVSNKYVNDITKQDIGSFLNSITLEFKLGGASLRRHLTGLSSLFSYGVAKELIDKNPIRNYDKRYLPPEEKRIRFLTEFEYNLLLSKCSYKLLQQVIILAVHTGFRKEELLSLTWEQIDLKKKEMSLYYTKNKEHRTIPIVPTTLDILQELYKERACPYVIQINGKRVKDFKKSFNTAKRKANIQDLHFHDLRHTFATWALKGWFTWQKQPFDLYKLQKWLGHKNIMTTQRYAHLETSDLHNMVGD